LLLLHLPHYCLQEGDLLQQLHLSIWLLIVQHVQARLRLLLLHLPHYCSQA
jgi:hypothetical protein